MELTEIGKLPISEDNPSGDDARYDPEFDALQQEIDKLSVASTVGVGINWERVVELGTAILAEKSKNYQVATYLGAALIQTRQMDGLADSLIVIKDLTETFWETMYPPKKRLRGRLNALTWWLDRVDAFLRSYDAGPLPQERVESIKANFRALDEALSEKTEDAPILRPYIDLVDRLPVLPAEAPAEAPSEVSPEAPETAAEPAKTAETPAKPAPAAKPAPSQAAAPAGEPTDRKDAEAQIESALNQLNRAAGFIQKDDLSNPLPYRLNRLAAWLTVDRQPVAEGNQTLLPPPDSSIKNAMENMLAGRDYENVVFAAEDRVTEFLFWLDLNYYSVQALEQMGPRYQDAIEAIALETALYISRLPGLETLAFNDGTPFAGKETRTWLKTIALGGGGGAAMVSGEGGGVGAEIAETYGKAQGLVKDKKVNDAVRLLEEGLGRGGAGRARLQWRIALVQLLVLLGRADLAGPHIDEILDIINTFQLERWEPELALLGLKAAYEGLTEPEDEEGEAKVRLVLNTLSRISPLEALQIVKR